jgi:hypothetical protein
MRSVHNMRNGSELMFSLEDPWEAVIAAFAWEHGDPNTWDYAKNYITTVVEGTYFVFCGDWACRK